MKNKKPLPTMTIQDIKLRNTQFQIVLEQPGDRIYTVIMELGCLETKEIFDYIYERFPISMSMTGDLVGRALRRNSEKYRERYKELIRQEEIKGFIGSGI